MIKNVIVLLLKVEVTRDEANFYCITTSSQYEKWKRYEFRKRYTSEYYKIREKCDESLTIFLFTMEVTNHSDSRKKIAENFVTCKEIQCI